MYFGKLMSRSAKLFSRKRISGNTTNIVTSSNTVTSNPHTNVLIFSLLFVIFSLEQNISAQSYKHMEIPVALISSTVETPNPEKQPTEEIKPEVITRPRFVSPRVAEINKIDESKIENKFYFPLKGLISSVYGESRRNHRHKGIDIAAPTGTPFYPAAPGKVIFAGWQRGYGNTLILEHGNGNVTRYAHASKLLVSCGDMVGIDDTIAVVGSTGRSTGPHLHFELMGGDGQQVNPLHILYKRDVPTTQPLDETVARENTASNNLKDEE
ncbi:MAG: metalloendopeptidase-like membrane protein [bacterium]|nr:MAG: metalloendopeptidase-like membrane protein [bacterium]